MKGSARSHVALICSTSSFQAPGPAAARTSISDTRAVAPRNGARAGRGRLWTRFPIRGPAVLDLFGAAIQMLGQGFAVVLGQDAGRASVDELVQIGRVSSEGERRHPQVRAILPN